MPPMPKRRRRLSRVLDDMPGLFDNVDIDMTEAENRAAVAAPKAPVSPDASNQDILVNTSVLERPQKLLFVSFGSGSSGNCAYVGAPGGRGVLIDAGVDSKFVTAALEANGLDINKIVGIILTHDHSDHVRYAYSLLRNNRHMLLYCTPRCLSGILRRSSLSRRIKDYHKPIYKEFAFEAAGLNITPFETSHDGTDNVGFDIDNGMRHFVVVTDTGYLTERAEAYVRRANYLMIESNYDADMLHNGTYPPYLQARIESECGHLDNRQAAAAVASVAVAHPEAHLSHVFLCHLSHDNNTPETATATMRKALEGVGRKVMSADHAVMPSPGTSDVLLAALPRFDSSPLYVLR